jgi:hypothetical protein
VILGVATLLGSVARAADDAAASETEKVAAELANPLSPVTTAAGQFRTEFGNGPNDDANFQLRLQPSFFQPFSDRSAFLMRTIMPVLFKNWPTDDTGLGDLTLVPYYVPDTTQSLFTGYGAAIGIPTATEDALGSEQWTAGPAMIVARAGNPITYGGLVQHIWSYAGEDDRGDISVTTVQPFFTYLLGDGWATTLTAETSYNWNADGDRWTVPLSAGLSKVVNLGGQYVNIGVSGVGYAEKPDYAPDWELRANVTYVFR